MLQGAAPRGLEFGVAALFDRKLRKLEVSGTPQTCRCSPQTIPEAFLVLLHTTFSGTSKDSPSTCHRV